jgi:Predicted membrane protein
MPLLTLPLFMVLFFALFPTLPPMVESTLGPYLGVYLARFLGYAAIFGLFAAISLVTFKPQVMPRIVRSLKVYETGMVIDKTMGLKAPLEVSEYKVNEERRFIEFKLNNQIFRIYYKDIKELNTILSKLLRQTLKQ